jgi:predicted Zn-dependent peptidase
MFRRTVLTNGLQIVTSSMPSARSVAMAVLIGGGSRYETTEQGGAFHFIEHLCFKGTRNHPTAKEISETIEGVGGVMNASTDPEVTTYWCKVARTHMSTGLELLADMVRNPLFIPEEVEKERGVILEELAMSWDHPDDRVSLLVDELLWPEHPLGRDTGGTPETVLGLSREVLLKCMASQYVPSNIVVTVAGDVAHEEVVDVMHGYLGDWPSGEPGGWLPVWDEQRAPRVYLERRNSEQTHIALAMRGLPANHPQRYVLYLLNTILGEGMSSRLFLELREEQGLVYGVNSSVSHFRDSGALTVYAATDPRNAIQALKTIVTELGKVKDDVSEAELSKAKEMAKGHLLLRLEDTRAVALWGGGQELLLGEIQTPEEIVSHIDAVTIEEVQTIARTLISPQRFNLAVVGPHRGSGRFEKLLGA